MSLWHTMLKFRPWSSTRSHVVWHYENCQAETSPGSFPVTLWEWYYCLFAYFTVWLMLSFQMGVYCLCRSCQELCACWHQVMDLQKNIKVCLVLIWGPSPTCPLAATVCWQRRDPDSYRVLVRSSNTPQLFLSSRFGRLTGRRPDDPDSEETTEFKASEADLAESMLAWWGRASDARSHAVSLLLLDFI